MEQKKGRHAALIERIRKSFATVERRGGRKGTRFSAEHKELALRGLAAGMGLKEVAREAGIGVNTLKRWAEKRTTNRTTRKGTSLKGMASAAAPVELQVIGKRSRKLSITHKFLAKRQFKFV